MLCVKYVQKWLCMYAVSCAAFQYTFFPSSLLNVTSLSPIHSLHCTDFTSTPFSNILSNTALNNTTLYYVVPYCTAVHVLQGSVP